MNIVAMGGGTGLSCLLHGLKTYVHDDRSADGTGSGQADGRVRQLSAVVAVSDDGGSSGRLRREFQVLPPGDIRNCLVALSEDEALLSRLFQFRFANGRGLKGHSFGNLFLTALTGITGDFHDAIKVCGEVLAIRGRIFPSTLSDVTLEAIMEDSSIIKGETDISRSRSPIARIRLVPAGCRPLPETLEAIREADVVTVGPGSLFTSLIPNLLVRGVARAVARCRGAKIFICNLMTQPGETTNYSAANHLRAVYEHCRFPLFDYVLLNTKEPSEAMRKRYLAQRSRPVEVDAAELEQLGVRLVTADLLAEERTMRSGRKRVVRHDSGLLAKAIVDIAAFHRLEITPTKSGRNSVRGGSCNRHKIATGVR